MASTPPDAAAEPLSVLIVSPDPAVHGGVSALIEMMKRRLRNCRVESFRIGSIQDRPETRGQVLRRLIVTPFRLMTLVGRRHFDVVHMNPSLTVKSTVRDSLLLLALRLAGYRRTLVYFHGWDRRVEQRIARTPGLKQFFVWLMNGAGHVTVLSPDFKQSLEDMGVKPDRVTFTWTMFDGAALKAFPASSSAQTGRTVLFMSRFERGKGVYELVEAFARVAAAFPDVTLIMAGDGPEREGLRQAVASRGIAGRVMFPGYVGGAEKSRLLLDCAVYALPTYLSGEGMPVAMFEAMGAEKPLLMGPAGAIPHIVKDPENGAILTSITPDTVETALRRLLSDPAYCAEAGKRNAVLAWSKFEAVSVTAGIENFYRKVACL